MVVNLPCLHIISTLGKGNLLSFPLSVENEMNMIRHYLIRYDKNSYQYMNTLNDYLI